MARMFGASVIKQTVTVYPGGTVFHSGAVEGTGEPQAVLHTLPFTPSRVLVVPINIPAGSSWTYQVVQVTSSAITVTVTAGVTFAVVAWTTASSDGPLRLKAPDASIWEVRADENGVLTTLAYAGQDGVESAVVDGSDGSRWSLTVDSEGILTTTKMQSEPSTARLAHYTPTTIPVPSLAWHGSLISVLEDGMDEELRYCRRMADGSYEWVIVAY